MLGFFSKSRQRLLLLLGVIAFAFTFYFSIPKESPIQAIEPTLINSQTSWAFDPPSDRFSNEALLDLRNLNETVAGETGFVATTPDGEQFLKGDGTPLRFWAVNTHVWRKGREALAEHARFLAKRGVNLVRWHGQIPAKTSESQLEDIDETAREQLWQLVAAMKQEGIYTTISPYYANILKPQPNWPLPRDSQSINGLLFFDPQLQAAYQNWLRALLEPVNPYTGIALKDEPAVAIIQLQNEDSLLFWTFEGIKGRDRELLQQQFSNWTRQKYGSLEAATNAWRRVKLEGDNLSAGIVDLYPMWQLTRREKYRPGKQQRLADQTQFLTETMRQFNAKMIRFLHEELGVKQLINAGNWKTADPVYLEDAERYSYTPSEIIGVNRYYSGGQHLGKHRGWAIVNGDRFTNRSVLFDPRAFPLNIKQVAGHPTILPESSWVPPLEYQSEAPFLVGVFQSLVGIDAFYWFATDKTQWRQPSSANGHLPSLGKWTIATPELMGNFPAAALLYRQGYVKSAETVVREQRSLESLWQRQTPLISEAPSFDPNRDRNSTSTSKIETKIDPLAFLVGKVEVSYGDSGDEEALALNSYLDKRRQTIRSLTGEVLWNYKQGFCTLNAPKAKGVTGFLRGLGKIDLGEVSIVSDNAYATVVLVAMDDRTLATSRQILVQTGTIARATDWEQQPITWEDRQGNEKQGYQVINYGKAPWRVANNQTTISIDNPNLSEAIALDLNGEARENLALRRRGSGLSFKLPPDTKYVILR